MKRNTMLVAALLLAATVLTATAQEARAADDPWPIRDRCETGGFDVTSVLSAPMEHGEPGDISVSVDGALTCGDMRPGATFALAYYWVGSAYARVQQRFGFKSYTKGGPHPFHATGGISPTMPVTICVLSDVDLRVACLEVSWNRMGNMHSVATRVVSPSDSSVDRPVFFVDNTLDPGCGACWRVAP